MQQLIIEAVRSLGEVGIGVLMFLENVFPPIPSELIMPLAGYLSAQSGDMDFLPAVAAGAVGSLAGAAFWYGVGRRVGEERLRAWSARHGVWLALEPDDIDRAQRWFRRHGGAVVLFGRMVPVVRTVISVPAGFARMPLSRFLAFSAAGTLVWVTALAFAGRALGRQFERVDAWIGWASWAVLGTATLLYLYRVARLKLRR